MLRNTTMGNIFAFTGMNYAADILSPPPTTLS